VEPQRRLVERRDFQDAGFETVGAVAIRLLGQRGGLGQALRDGPVGQARESERARVAGLDVGERDRSPRTIK
jgi:hypothetical protein